MRGFEPLLHVFLGAVQVMQLLSTPPGCKHLCKLIRVLSDAEYLIAVLEFLPGT